MALPTQPQLTADMHNVTNDMHDVSLEEKEKTTTQRRAADAPDPLNDGSHGNGAAQQLLPPPPPPPPPQQQQQQHHEQSQHLPSSSLFAQQLPPNLTLHSFTLPIRGAVPSGEDKDDSNKFTSTPAVPAHNNNAELEDAVVDDDQANNHNNNVASSPSTLTLSYSAARYHAMQTAAFRNNNASSNRLTVEDVADERELRRFFDAGGRAEMLPDFVGASFQFVGGRDFPGGSFVDGSFQFVGGRAAATTRPANIVPLDDDDGNEQHPQPPQGPAPTSAAFTAPPHTPLHPPPGQHTATTLANAFVRAAVHLGIDDADREREISQLLTRLPRRPADGAVDPAHRDQLARRGMALVGPRGWSVVAYVADGAAEGGRREVEVHAPREALDQRKMDSRYSLRGWGKN
ncbi:hypothetical protein UCDDS831_g05879 [Diplodia seriata]|uniref:Uncharacterized protein n=1 Tax=Diplodia seriata TaxID=420778 RepID=A0A0G2G451_9PEZI|nr:hypothetical protein UCDDS831_g05879 [Diplodia seriata]